MTSITNSHNDVSGALQAMEKPQNGFGQDLVWRPSNQRQEYFLQNIWPTCRTEVDVLTSLGLLDATASDTVKEVNAWIAERGYDIQLDDIGVPSIYTACEFKALVMWAKEGEVRPLVGKNGKQYDDAVWMNEDLQFFSDGKSDNVIVKIPTRDQMFAAYMQVCEKPNDEVFGLVQQAQEVQEVMKQVYTHDSLHFPMVHINHQVDLSWMLGMATKNQKGEVLDIKVALQQTILMINEKGALAKSMAALGAVRAISIPKPTLEINAPFLFWLSSPESDLPLFAAWIDYDNWENPGDIETTT